MCPIGSLECGSNLETLADASSAIDSTSSDGVFCCPECGTRLHLIGRSAVARAAPLVQTNELPSTRIACDVQPAGSSGESAEPVEPAQNPVAPESCDLPSPREHSGFFGVLSNLMVDWEDADGDAPSRVRCSRGPIVAPVEHANAADYDPVDIDWLLESVIRLASEDDGDALNATKEPSAAMARTDVDSRSSQDTTRGTESGDLGVYGIDMAELDVSVIPITVVEEASTEETECRAPVDSDADSESSAGRVSTSEGTVAGSPQELVDASVTNAPHVADSTLLPSIGSSRRLVWLGVGVAAVVGLAILSHHQRRATLDGRVAPHPKAHAIAPLAPVTQTFSVLAATALEPSQPAPTVDELPLQVDIATAKSTMPMVKTPEPVAGDEDAQAEASDLSSLARLESQPQLAPEPVANPAPEPEPTVATFDAEAAASALDQVAERASFCRQAGDPSGMAVVSITLASSGRVTTATISEPPFKGTSTGSCVASLMRTARVPAFAGSFATVTKIVTIR